MDNRLRSLPAFFVILVSGAACSETAPRYPVVVPVAADPLLSGLAIPATANTRGMWSPTRPWPLIGLHLTVMPDGRVLSFGTPAGQHRQDGRTLDIWDPAAGFTAASHLLIADGERVDSFCSAAVTLPATGTIFIAGGASYASAYQAFSSTLITPAASSAVNSGHRLAAQHWYGTMTTLADGRALMTGGGAPYAIVSAYADPVAAQPHISTTPEIYTPGKGWTRLVNATSNDAFGPINNRAWYPRQWVVPSGKVFGISTDAMWLLDPDAGSIRTLGAFKTTVDTATLPNVGPTSTAVMYDSGLVLQVGGNGYNNESDTPSSPYATVFDITVGDVPVVTETTRMAYARQWPNSLVLPDGKVVVTGGSTAGDRAGADAVYPAELWDPATGRWTTGASAANYRGYHSATALLPDGVVLSTGGGAPGPVNNLNAEIYYPPYLFAVADGKTVLAARPRIVSLSANAAEYGARVAVQMADASAVSAVSLIGLSSVTHGFNTFQRRIRSTYSKSGEVLAVTMPASGNIAPPGYYLLTVLDANKVPSIGAVLAIHAAAPPTRSVTALLPIDGVARTIVGSTLPQVVLLRQDRTSAAPAGASFYTRKGLAGTGCYSFESNARRGDYLRQRDDRIELLPDDRSITTAADSTFCAVAGLNGSGFSLRSFNQPTRYIRRRADGAWLDSNDGYSGFKDDASFHLASAALPVDHALHSIANLAQYGALVRHSGRVGYVSSINAASSAAETAQASFYIRRGHAGAACYSFETSKPAGYFLRRRHGAVVLAPDDGSAEFARDSTMCLVTGRAGQGMSLVAYADRKVYLRQDQGRLFFKAADGTPQFDADATFSVVPTPLAR